MPEENNKKDIVHFVYCPFTGLGLHKGYRGDGWLRNRIKIFKDFPLRSLLAQPEKNFILWISWRPEEKSNPQVRELADYLRATGLNFIFTFHGLCFWDDKYQNDKLLERLEKTLPELECFIKKETKYVYMTIQPSDDTYWMDAMREIECQPYRYKGAYGYSNGYILNMRTMELAEYNPEIYPPFYTIMFPTAEFLSPYQHYTYIGPYVDHGKIPSMFETVNSNIRGFIVGIHGENISTVWNEPGRGRVLSIDERDEVFRYYGLQNSQPVKLKTHTWLVLKRIYNKLPKSLKKTARSAFYYLFIRN